MSDKAHITHLETDVTEACQLSCVNCNHAVPLHRAKPGGPRGTTPQIVERDLAHLAPILRTDAWGALGGEPTLSKHLVDILHVVRDSRIANEIEVWTNGLTIRKQTPAFWRAFDVLVVSLYPGYATDADVAWMQAKCADEGVRFVPKDERVTPNFQNWLDPEPSDPVRTQAKYDSCFFRSFSRAVNRGYFHTCCCGPQIPEMIQGLPFGTDGIAVEGLTKEALVAYLESTTPLGACTVCAGRDAPAASPQPWREERDPAVWRHKSAGHDEP